MSLCHLGDWDAMQSAPRCGTNEAASSQGYGFILDALRHVKPVEIVMHQLRQASVKLPRTSQNAGCCIHHTLQFVADDLLEPGRERHYSSPPMTLQKCGRVLPQTPQ